MILFHAGTTLILDPVKTLYLSAIFTAITFAATPSIGIVTASGHFTLQGSEVWGNATLFDGASLQTTDASTELALHNGAKVQLGAKSRARIYADHLLLESGVGQVTAAAPFEVDAAGFKIRGDGRVRVGLTQQVEIAALAGTARVATGKDVLLAAIPSGRSMNFAFQAAQSATLTRAGCLLYKDNRFILQDDATQEVVELNGQDLAMNVGNRVEVTGTASTTRPSVTIATSVMNVTAVSPRSQGGCLVVASSLDARTDVPRTGPAGTTGQAPAPRPAGGGGGLSTGAKAAIIIAIAGGGGAGAAIALSGSKKSTSP